jgi:hypothetical protein
MSANYYRFVLSMMAACAMAALALAMAQDAFAAGPRQIAATFNATTANMTPANIALRMQIIEWQEAAARSEVVASMAAGADAATPLAKLPTVGYVWPAGSPVGYSVKYAHRAPAPNGGERITLVTDRKLGSYDYKGWSVPSPAAKSDTPYSVIELQVDAAGTGTGSFSLAAEVVLDEQGGTVALQDGAPTLLTNVKRETAK